MGMTFLIKAGQRECRDPRLQTGIVVPVVRAFMDDLTITTVTHVQARWVLAALDEVATWARMTFKPRKSRSLIIRGGKVVNRFSLIIQGEEIPSIVNNPIKCLGKWYDELLCDKNSVKQMESQIKEWLRKIEKSGLPGKYKTWIYQHGLLARAMWGLMLYDISISAVEGLERTVSRWLRKWIGVPPSFSQVGLYSRSAELQLPFSSMSEEFKVAKCRLALTIRDSQDSKVREAGVVTRSGRRWSASTTISQAESTLQIRDVIGNTCVGRQGLGTSHFQEWGKANKRQRREIIQAEVRLSEEETRKAKAVQMGQQVAWTRWNLPEKRLTWSDIWSKEPMHIQFLLRSVYDVLPSPTNLQRWGLVDDPSCQLCGERESLAHILSGCKVSLQQGRYRWRHDQVLKTVVDIVDTKRKTSTSQPKTTRFIHFVRAGERSTESKQQSCILDGVNWEMRVDLGRKLVFPSVVETTLRPDLILWSDIRQCIIIIELTVPWEEGCEEAHERKSSKYCELTEACRAKGWKTWFFPVEVGCRGFPARSVWWMLEKLGVRGRAKKAAVRRLGETAERTSCWLWYRRGECSWKPQ